KINEMDYFNWQLDNGQTLNQWFVSQFNPDIKMLEEFCLMGYRSEITFKVDKKGNFKSYYVSNSSALRDYDRVLARFLQTMPALNLDLLMPDYTYDHACILTFSSKRSKSGEGFAQQFKAENKDSIDNPMRNV